MISPSKLKIARQAILDEAEDQLALLRDDGLRDHQEMEFVQDLADVFASQADELDDLTNHGDDEDEEDDDDPGSID